MARRKRPPRRMTVFRCPMELFERMEPISRRFRGGRSAYMVAALLAMLTKLGKEGGVTPVKRVPPPSPEVRASFKHLRPKRKAKRRAPQPPQ